MFQHLHRSLDSHSLTGGDFRVLHWFGQCLVLIAERGDSIQLNQRSHRDASMDLFARTRSFSFKVHFERAKQA